MINTGKTKPLTKKVVKTYTYRGLGFAVPLTNVTMYKIGKSWAPKIDVIKISKKVIKEFKNKEKLTGYEIFFIRSYLSLSTVDFAKKMNVSKTTVQKWEKTRAKKVKLSPEELNQMKSLLKVRA